MFGIIIIGLTGCQTYKESSEKDEVKEISSFCKETQDCKKFLIDWPCESQIARKDAPIKEDFCIEPCSRGAVSEFCKWSYIKPICRNNVCVGEIDCEKMQEILDIQDAKCDALEKTLGPRQVKGIDRNYVWWDQFCQLYISCVTKE